jgi:tol-pal system protein YbgF
MIRRFGRIGMRALGLLAAVGLWLPITGCVTTSDIEGIQAQLSDIQRQVLLLQKETSSKDEVEDLRTEVATQTEKLLESEAEMLVGLEQVSAQIDQLQTNLGDTNYRLAQLSQQITATNQELLAVRSALGGALREPTSAAGRAAEPPPDNPRDLYQSAYNDYLSGNYDLAILGFRRYLEAFPSTDLADNAAYWIAESYFSQREYTQAIKVFDRILQDYPRSDKTASVFLKKGYAYLEMGQREQGLVQLRHVIREFPETDDAKLARQRMRALGVDGD